VLSLLGAAALVLAVGASPASAVYAGSNGRVAYTLYSSGGSDIYSVAPNAPGTRRLTFGGKSSHPRWSFGGAQLAFQRGSTTTGTFVGDLYVMHADGSGVRRVTQGAGAQQPVWSPRADELMFIKRVDGHTDLFRVPVPGGALRRVTFAAAFGCDADHPSWRGSLVVYHRLCPGKSDEIRLLDLTSGVNRIVIAGNPAAGESVSWPDFTRDLRIMFLACLKSDPVCLSTQNVHVINQDGTGRWSSPIPPDAAPSRVFSPLSRRPTARPTSSHRGAEQTDSRPCGSWAAPAIRRARWSTAVPTGHWSRTGNERRPDWPPPAVGGLSSEPKNAFALPVLELGAGLGSEVHVSHGGARPVCRGGPAQTWEFPHPLLHRCAISQVTGPRMAGHKSSVTGHAGGARLGVLPARRSR